MNFYKLNATNHFKSNFLFKLGFIILFLYCLVAILTPVLINLNAIPDSHNGLNSPSFSPPTLSHWCGTDRLGRDVCVRTCEGCGVALKVVLIAITLAVSIGIPLGLISGYVGGFLDRILLLIMDTLYTIPVLLLSVVTAFVLGKGILNASLALCVVYVPQYFRVVRNETMQVKNEAYIMAAKSLGANSLWIIRKYLFRNVISSIPILLTMNAADAVLVLGGLGFLGLGLPESVPEWGSDLNMALVAMPTGIWWTALYPGFAMFGLVIGLSLIGDGIENLFNISKNKI